MSTKAPDTLETRRLFLRRPVAADAESIFERYAGDPEVTRFLGWPTHGTVEATRAFLAFSDAEWERWPAGPYLVFAKEDRRLLGGAGFSFETPYRAATGYVFAQDAWGRGYATESLKAMCDLAPSLGLRRLYALCHVEHRASAHVIEKCGFVREGVLRRHTEFPNLHPGEPLDAFCYSHTW